MKNFILSLILFAGLIISGCSHTSELSMKTLPENQSAISYSVTYYIHADSDYLYHTPDGKPVRENSKILTTAFDVAEAAHSGEVFIYHQRPERKFLGLFPRKSSRFYHYKNGQLINRVNYRHPDKKEAFLATEAQLMKQYRAHNRTETHQNYFLYSGHELPSENGFGYHQTLPDINVNTAAFAKGIQNFLLSDDDRFSLVVLSTCNNGTPAMADHLAPFTDLMLASPQNLHLSHINSDAIAKLETEPGTSPTQIAHSMAEQTFERLEETVLTTITLALYDFKDVRAYINSLASLTASDEIPDPSIQFQDNVDCAMLSLPDSARFREGVETWFKPARFGRQSGRNTHSGWGCKPGVR
ncbi:hypothetical protein [Rhodohalobacter sp. 8-1]|uniref:hypothetical protein n=1 Tax=Rhodohalobacter sp. 8-1 TaxID=3131972 RepID=UPI0030EB344A